jgi:peptidoglycan L-alanyl-D-glutamate endopeptidase CwlK
MLPGPFKFGRVSLRQFNTLHPALMNIFREAIKQVDFSILEGRRTIEQQRINVIKGVSKTLDSKHIPRYVIGPMLGYYAPNESSYAVDIIPYQKGVNPWPQSNDSEDIKRKKLYRFYFLQGIIYSIAHSMKIEIRQGIDWDRDFDFFDQTFDDMGHVELVVLGFPDLIVKK